MKKFILLIISPVLFSSLAHAEVLYTAPTAVGGNNGTNCANAFAAAIYINNVANWGGGAGEIDPGDTVHFCSGTYTGAPGTNGYIKFPASGSAGNIVTFIADTGANFTATYWGSTGGAIDCNGKGYITVDGGGNATGTTRGAGTGGGSIVATANGDALANQQSSVGIWSSVTGCNHWTVKNWVVSNIYVKVENNASTTDDSVAIGCGPDCGGNFIATHNTVDHSEEAFNAGSDNNLEISYNLTSFNSRAIVMGISGVDGNATGWSVHDNDIGGGGYIYDQVGNSYHHNCVQVFDEAAVGVTITGFSLYNNYCHGIWTRNQSGHTTACMFINDYPVGAGGQITAYVFNNVCSFDAGDFGVANGYFTSGQGGSKIYNNTAIGYALGGGFCISIANTNNTVAKNNVCWEPGFAAQLAGSVGTATIDKNTYYQTNSWFSNGVGGGCGTGTNTFMQWQSLCGADVTGQNGNDTKLNANGSLQAGSSAIGFGTNLTTSCGTIPQLCSDMDGVARPGGATAWDAGALQFGSSPPPTPAAPTGLRIIMIQ